MKPGNRKIPLFVSAVVLTLCILLYRPLPDGFTKSYSDRIKMHISEPGLRLIYYYPSRMFSKPSTMVWWTRHSLDYMAKITGFTSTFFDDTVDVEAKTWNGASVRVYNPLYTTKTGGAVLFIHGGGFGIGSVDMYDTLTRRLARKMKTLVVSVEYRLSPETPFPGGLNDCEAALNYLYANGTFEYGIDANRVIVMGDSAGGNLATVLAQRRTARGTEPKLAAQVLMYPLLQFMDLQTISYRYFLHRLNGLALVDPETIAYYYMFYAGIDMNTKPYDFVETIMSNGHLSDNVRRKANKIMSHGEHLEIHQNYKNESIPTRWQVKHHEEVKQLLEPFLTNPDFVPLMREDLSGLPKTLIVTVEFDILRDEGMIYAERLKAAKVPTTYLHYENGFHAMFNVHEGIDVAYDAMEDIIKWTSKALSN